MSEIIQVVKRNGDKEYLDMDKIHKVVEWSCDGLSNVSMSEVELNAKIKFIDGIKTEDIHSILIKSAHDLISEENPNYEYVAARLLNYQLRKKVYNSSNPHSLTTTIKLNIEVNKVYDPILLEKYTNEDLNTLNKYIKYERDYAFTYSGLQQLVDKYLLQNRNTGEIYETPQEMYMMVAMGIAIDEPVDKRIKLVKEWYDAFSTFKINLPTPIMAGVRTKLRQYSSCVVIEVGDSLDSIFSSAQAVGYYSAKRAGIGLSFGNLRAIGSSIRNGEVVSTGLIPFLKIFESSVKSTSQNGLRGGSANTHLPVWHYEVMDFLKLRDPSGTEENRVRKLDYTLMIDDLFVERLRNDDNYTLFSPSEVPGLYDNFGFNPEDFRRLYEKYEKNNKIRKKVFKAREIFNHFIAQRINTGKIYWMNIDEVNRHSPFTVPIRQSNLCEEITLPTKPLSHIDDENAWIAICILAAINVGTIKHYDDLERIMYLVVRMLDNLIDLQEYPVKAAEIYTKGFRSLGIGITNFAYYIARKKIGYSTQEANDEMHRLSEAIQYWGIKASVDLAKEKGQAPFFNQTKYSQGILPIDTYNKNVDEIVNVSYMYDWESLRKDIIKYGMRNTAITAQAPTQSSAVVTGAIGAHYPPQKAVTGHKSKLGILKQVTPGYRHLKKYYDLCFEMPDGNTRLIEKTAIMQKFGDQSISLNLYYDYEQYENNSLPLSVVAKDILYCNKYGVKTIYYSVTNDGNKQDVADKEKIDIPVSDNKFGISTLNLESEKIMVDDSGCESGACEV